MKTLLIALIWIIPAVAFAQEERWIKIAEKTVAFKSDKDVVKPNGKERSVDKIRLRCTEGTVKIKKVTIKMSNGQSKEFNARGLGVLNKGMKSMAYKVPNKEEKVEEIILEYDSMGNMLVTDKAHVEIEGRVRRD